MEPLNVKVKKQLLFHENYINYRPVEICAYCWSYHLFYAMFNEDGVYRIPRGSNGMLYAVSYDVTEYEIGKRRAKSPLVALSNGLAAKITKDDEVLKLMATPLMKSWSSKKFSLNSPMIFLWFLSRVLLCVAFYFTDIRDEYNNENKECPSLPRIKGIGWTISIVIAASGVLIFDACDLVYTTIKVSHITCYITYTCRHHYMLLIQVSYITFYLYIYK